ncbi:MAG TPA: hypothetical protein VLG41_21220 [Hydrogenophaga sp.]|uniref:hypothetical protein n=1 Tax=Hydrogenophaga sp. TaxID=1904254 RepID=UPI002BFFC789|nr:hypothetical protein [Hydrogenophaga sp.]HSX95460.1 hypothetical protein [Hydrogenophaga sp.]
MTPVPTPLSPELPRLLQAEPELFGECRVEAEVVSGVLQHEHPMAWRCLAELDAVEALTLVSPSPAELDTMPDWRDPGWDVSTQDIVPGEALTLWWHADTQQAMLASMIPIDELRHDAVARTLRLHTEGLALCRRLAQQAWAEARPQDAIALAEPLQGWRLA